MNEYEDKIGTVINGIVGRVEGNIVRLELGKAQGIMPRSEQIPGETHHVNERVRATVFEVRKSGSRVKVILSRTRPQLVQRLFEQEIPEIIDGVIEVRAMAREPGYRSKVAVSSSDARGSKVTPRSDSLDSGGASSASTADTPMRPAGISSNSASTASPWPTISGARIPATRTCSTRCSGPGSESRARRASVAAWWCTPSSRAAPGSIAASRCSPRSSSGCGCSGDMTRPSCRPLCLMR